MDEQKKLIFNGLQARFFHNHFALTITECCLKLDRMQKRYLQAILGAFLLLCTAQCKKAGAPVFKSVPAAQSGLEFTNRLTLNDSLTVLDFEYIFNGGGAALIDINNDGLQDVFFTGNMVSCRLFLNKGNLKFEDITDKAGVNTKGWCYGASVVDINQDGFKDIYVCVAGNAKTLPSQMGNYFFINNGNGTFSDKATEMGLLETGHDVQAAFLDYDSDGDLDMYLLKNAFVSYNRNQIRQKQLDGLAASNDKFFRNNGPNQAGIIQFEDVSNAAGITIEGFGLGIAACDINEDGWTDLYISNDFLTNDLVWENDQKGGFVNKAPQYLKHQTYNAMGNDVADFNNDGKMDVVVVDMLPPDNKRWKLTIMGNRFDEFQQALNAGYEPQYVRNTLQLNTGTDPNGEPTFSEIGQMAGMNATEWSWAPLLADYDNDGWKDLFIANGYRQDVTNLDFIMYGKTALFMGTPEANRKERIAELKKYVGIQVPNVMYRNKRDLTFEDVSKNWGIGDEPTYSNGAAYGDLDNDGDLDLVINNLDQTASLFENTAAQRKDNQYLRIKLDGAAPNRDAYGTKLWIWQNGQQQYQYFAPLRGYLSTMEHFMHFGLAPGNVDSLRVRWPNGREQRLTNIAPNQVLALDIKNAADHAAPMRTEAPSLALKEVSAQVGIDFTHVEDDFLDFKVQALLPHLHSRNGPPLAVADLNGDGLEDFAVGAAAGAVRELFFQKKDGTFEGKPFPQTNTADDMAFCFLDADGDGDTDWYVAAGGVLPEKNGEMPYKHRFYLNDGKGNFTENENLPDIKVSAGSVSAADIDHDGDLDLFVGGRVCPGEYPKTPRSFLLRNDTQKGNPASLKFTDITPEALQYPGMVTAAIWSDFDQDGQADLLLTGEYMPVLFFKNVNGRLEAQKTPFPSGWWDSLVAGDFDQDGDIDYLAGNRGLNGFFKATTEEPIRLYAADYDKNDLIDPIMTYYGSGEEYIAHAREDLNKQITAMRGRFRNYSEYAEKTFAKSFRKDELAGAQKLSAETFASVYIENKGKGQFILKNLPNEAQIAPICGMITEDINHDGKLDVLCVGNSFSTEVQTGRYDAQASFALLGDGHGNFSWQRHVFYMDGDGKSVAKLRLAGGNELLLAGRNSARLLAFTYKSPQK